MRTNTDLWGWLLAVRAKMNNVRMQYQAQTREVAYLAFCLFDICTCVRCGTSTVKLQRRDCCARNMSGLCMQRRCSWSPQEGWRSQKSFVALWNVCTLDIQRYEESVVENSRFCENVFFFTLEMPLAPQSQKPNLRLAARFMQEKSKYQLPPGSTAILIWNFWIRNFLAVAIRLASTTAMANVFLQAYDSNGLEVSNVDCKTSDKPFFSRFWLT